MRLEMRRLMFLAMCFCVYGFGAAVVHVSPDGNDGIGGFGPFRTLEAARRRVAEMRKEKRWQNKPITVEFSQGVYPLTEEVVFTPLDSGSENAPTVYRAAKDADVVFSGGRELTGIQVAANGDWRVLLPEVAEGKAYYEQLYVNGRHATRARTPNVASPAEYFYIERPVVRAVDPATGERVLMERRAFYGELNDLSILSGVPLSSLSDVVIVMYHSWETSRHRVSYVDGKRGFVVLSGDAPWRMMDWRNRQRYHIENIPEALDAAGEWYLARDGWLTYKPLPGETLENTKLVVPVAKSFLRFEGEPAAGLLVSKLRFENLRFLYAGYKLPAKGHGAGQAEVDIPAVISCVGTADVEFVGCEVGSVGIYGVQFGDGCFGNALRRCYLHDLGAGGVKIGGDGRRPADERSATSHNVVDNCIIQTGGRIHHGAIGVWLGHVCDNKVTHNDIGDFYYTGVSVGWTWGYAPTVSVRNKIEFNRIHHIGQGMLSDMGGVYTLGYAKGTSVSNNHIHDVYSYDYYGAGAHGLYTDEGTTEILMENNLVHHTRGGGLHQHYGRDNVIRNNIFAYGMFSQVQRSRREDHRSFTLERNIIYWDNDSPLFNRSVLDDMVDIHHNLYWTTGGKVDFNTKTFEEWQALGKGEGDVIADPKFADPEAGDYSLAADSPAHQIGFVPFDYTLAGVYGPPAWKAKAAALKVPPLVLTPKPPPIKLKVLDGGFEEHFPGDEPLGTSIYTEKNPGLIEVTTEMAKYGKHCVKLQDSPKMKYQFNPHFHYLTKLKDGIAEASFSVAIEQDMTLYVDLRDYTVKKEFAVGCNLLFSKGMLAFTGVDGKRTSISLPEKEWVDVVVRVGVGNKKSSSYIVTITLPGAEPKSYEAKLVDNEFSMLTWFGFVADGTNSSACWLDNIDCKLVGDTK